MVSSSMVSESSMSLRASGSNWTLRVLAPASWWRQYRER